MLPLLLVALASAPTVGSTYRMTLVAVSQTRSDGKLDPRDLSPGTTTLDATVLAMTDGQPSKLSLNLLHSDVYEFQYGGGPDPEVTLSLGEVTFTGGPVISAHSRASALRVLLASLIRPDPVVAAAASVAKAPCSPEALGAIGAAAGKLANRALFDATLLVVDGATATCVKGKEGQSWAVRFSLLNEGANDNTIVFTGTVSVPKNAWRANLDLKASVTLVKASPGKPAMTGTLDFSATTYPR